MQQSSLFDLGYQDEPIRRKKPGGRDGKTQKGEQYQSGYMVTPQGGLGVTEKNEQNQQGYTVTPGYAQIYNNHKMKTGDGEEVSLSEDGTTADPKKIPRCPTTSYETRCNLVTHSKSFENSGYSKEGAWCNGVTMQKNENKSHLPAGYPQKPLVDRKTDRFLEALQDLTAAREGGEALLDTYLPKAKVLLDGGLWWRRASTWTDDRLGKAMKDWFVSEAAFTEMLEIWKEAILAGCLRMRSAVKSRKG